MNPFYKKEYSPVEVSELIAWFEARIDRLPSSLVIDAATETDDLPRTVKSYIRIISKGVPNVSFCGYVAQLMRIRSLVENNLAPEKA